MLKEWLLAISLILAFSSGAFADIKVVTTIPDIAWAAKEIGQDKVDVKSFLKGIENPHFADAVPEFIRLAANADVVCLVGLDLEVGWLPKVLARSGNAKVQPGGKGYCDLGKSIKPMDVPAGGVDRSMGDIHPFGNPHYWLSPTVFGDAARAISEALSAADPENAAFFEKNLAVLQKKLNETRDRNRAKLGPLLAKLSGPVAIEYHKEFVYFADAYGIKLMGAIEEKPGVLPSAGRLAQIAAQARRAGLKFALSAHYNPKNVLGKFRELSGVPVLFLQTNVQPKGEIVDYVKLQDHLVDQILRALVAQAK